MQAIGEIQRKGSIDAIRRALTVLGPDLGVSEEAHGIAGDAGEIYGNVDTLIQIARRTTADFVEPFMAQVHEDLCTKCKHQANSGYCHLREEKTCTLDRAMVPVFEAITGALYNTEDPEYIAYHGDGCAACSSESTRACQCGDSEVAAADFSI